MTSKSLLIGWISWLQGTVGWQHALEFLAGFMATKWLVGMMAGLGPVGVAIAAIVAALAIAKSAMGDFDLSKLPIGSPLWQGVSENEQLKYPNSPASQAAYGGGNNPNQFSWWNPGSWLGHGPRAPDNAGMSDYIKRTWLSGLPWHTRCWYEATTYIGRHITHSVGNR